MDRPGLPDRLVMLQTAFAWTPPGVAGLTPTEYLVEAYLVEVDESGAGAADAGETIRRLTPRIPAIPSRSPARLNPNVMMLITPSQGEHDGRAYQQGRQPDQLYGGKVKVLQYGRLSVPMTITMGGLTPVGSILTPRPI